MSSLYFFFKELQLFAVDLRLFLFLFLSSFSLKLSSDPLESTERLSHRWTCWEEDARFAVYNIICIFLAAGKSIELEGLKRDFFSRVVLRAYVLSLTVAGELALGDVRSPCPWQRTCLRTDCLNDNPRQIRISAGH